VRWIKAGIKLERIETGHPEQNGCHERMHQTPQDPYLCDAGRDHRRTAGAL
jgi:hypothetical protein